MGGSSHTLKISRSQVHMSMQLKGCQENNTQAESRIDTKTADTRCTTELNETNSCNCDLTTRVVINTKSPQKVQKISKVRLSNVGFSNFSFQFSVFSFQFSVFSFQFSVFSYQFSVFRFQFSVFQFFSFSVFQFFSFSVFQFFSFLVF